MARIRTIKPEFFTSEDICDLKPLERLLYVALWCEADREGRLVWKPRTFKIRYLPEDDCDINALCAALVNAGLVVLYEVGGEKLAVIPTFLEHQQINNRETESKLPEPPTRQARVRNASCTRGDASLEEGKGKEGKGREGEKHAQGARLPTDWQPEGEELRWAVDARPDLAVRLEVEKFRDYWHGVAGAKGRKLDWKATWRNWIRNANGPPGGRNTAPENRSPAASRPL